MMQKDDLESLYASICQKEKRTLSDSEVMFLPDIDAAHNYYQEWQIRKRSSQKLITYLKKKNKPLNILEVGCGNGWLCSNLATIAGICVTGLDINQLEIEQAKRVFRKYNLTFICESFEPDKFYDKKFDIILFAASVQYFPSLQNIIGKALTCLAPKGEIHITDTLFYSQEEARSAAKKSADYYKTLGYPQMAAHYFHHTTNHLMNFNYRILTNPVSLFNRFSKKEPFYWIVITH